MAASVRTYASIPLSLHPVSPHSCQLAAASTSVAPQQRRAGRPICLTCSWPHVQVKKMTRADMTLVRRALGTPRRLSDAFLHEERCMLAAHRERCRSAYEKWHATEGLLLPGDVPTQCAVGQHVVARHPQLRTLHDGDVLTVNASTYMVQFRRSELGVWKVRARLDLAHTHSQITVLHSQGHSQGHSRWLLT